MRKFILLFSALFISFFLSTKSFAYSADELAQNIQNEMNHAYNLNYVYDQNLVSFASFWIQNPNYKFVMWKPSSDVYIYIGTPMTQSGSTFTYENAYWYDRAPSASSCLNRTNGSVNTNNTLIIYNDLNDFMPNIDFSNTIYNPTISVPSFRCLIGSYSSSLCVPVNLMFDSPQGISSYYIEFKYRYYKPNTVKLDLQNGINYYTIDFDSSDWFYLYSMEDLMKFSDLDLNAQMNTYFLNLNSVNFDCLDNWTDFYNSVSTSFISQYDSSASSAFQNAKDRYLFNNKSSVFYGNSTEIFVRFFTIDQDNIVSVGDWRHWYSTSSNVFDIVSGKYFDGQEINSGSAAVSDFDQNIISQSSNNPPQTSDQGTTIVINNNQVPNYQNYETAVSYNHDNILLQFIQTSKQLPSFFDGFSAFLTSAFGFIPSQIWSIIGFGFMASIIIMIIKIL